jgi:murein DD-endopeptidase MepM/ murein hydrolase activator NlpD
MPITAAEDGVVSYAGNGFAGQGNLVLIRHSNGYSTVYAHAKELLVKLGDQIKRGQVIAHSAQTGNVNAPQLHFEVRKGATPPRRLDGPVWSVSDRGTAGALAGC